MEITEASPREYNQAFFSTYHIFNSVEFNVLNESKSEQLLFLIFKDTKIRLGLIAGVKAKSLYSPFSAPFGGFSYLKEDVTIAQMDASVDALQHYATGRVQSIHYTLPPLFYNELFNNKLLNVLYRKGFKISAIDLNYAFNLEKLTDDYETNIWYNARKNLRISLKSGFDFVKCESEESKREAYEVIKENRNRKGYPLKMTYEQVEKTTKVITADFFLLKKGDDKVAAAQIFHVTKKIVQVIYWGDIPDFVNYKPMNFLAWSVFKYYKNLGFKYVDIGPSTENGIPNYGLCEFKEGIGCDITPKISFTKELT
jgi:hypothetical protein